MMWTARLSSGVIGGLLGVTLFALALPAGAGEPGHAEEERNRAKEQKDKRAASAAQARRSKKAEGGEQGAKDGKRISKLVRLSRPAARSSVKARPSASTQCSSARTRVDAGRTVSELTYNRSGDTCGAVYWLGSHSRTRAFQNPADRGVTVRVSSVGQDSKPGTELLGRQLIRFTTRPEARPWVEFDFGDRRISPSHYALRHYSSWDTEALRSWRLEGSVDGTSWVVLREHKGDSTLNKKGARGVWRLTSRAAAAAYSRFRITMTGLNSNQHRTLALSEFEIYGELSESSSTPQTPLGGQEAELRYRSDFDTNGAIHFVGTNGGAASFRNPVDSGAMTVTASSLDRSSAQPKELLDRRTLRFTTKPQRNSWVEFDFGDRRLVPTAYTLKHYSSWDTEALRDWVLEGSNDRDSWTVIRRHVGDTSLNHKGESKTWTLSSGTSAYRYFRVKMTGPNSNNHHSLSLSGVEFYGRLKSFAHPTSSSATTFTHRSDFDQNGVMYHLGSEALTAFRNPAERGRVIVEAQPPGYQSEAASELLARRTLRFITRPSRDAQVTFDLKSKKVRVSKYTLGHYKSWDGEALRNWVLEGSNDKRHWTLLREHVNDAALSAKGQSHTWAIPSTRSKTAYRYLRLRITGPNSSQHYAIALSGFEVYGTLE